MAQYVFKYRGRGVLPRTAKAKIKKRPELALIQDAKNELVVSAPAADLKRFGEELDGWFFAAVKSIPRPPVGAKRHPRVRRID